MKWCLALALAMIACKSEPPKPLDFSGRIPIVKEIEKEKESTDQEAKVPDEESKEPDSPSTETKTPGEETPEKPNPDTPKPDPEPETPKPDPEPPQPSAPKFDLLERRLDEATFLTSHNSFVNRKDSSFAIVNQSMSLKDQLENGVEAVMLDIHNGKGKVLMCHGQCQPLAIGVFPTQDLGKALDTMADFVNSRPELILTVILEDYAGTNELKAELDRHPKFRDLMFNPYAADVINKGWPKIRDMIAMKKRILVISDRSDKKDLGIGFAQDLTIENYWSTGKSGTDLECRQRWDNMPLNKTDPKFNRLFVMNHFRDIPGSSFSAKDNQKDFLWDRMEKECITKAGRRPNYIAVDHFDEGDWGARKLVGDMNTQVGAIIFKDNEYGGGAQVLRAGRYKASDLKLGDNQISSVRVFQGYRVKLYSNDNFESLLMNLVKDTAGFPTGNDETSSIIVERI